VRASRPVAGLLMIGVLLSSGCGKIIDGRPSASPMADADQALIVSYFERSNAAAHGGAAAQRRFLTSAQHPDVEQRCDLGELTVLLGPSLSTLRPDERWRPTGSTVTPRGRVYVIAVTVTVQREGMTLGTQIGSMHVVVLDGMAYGFAPCPT